MDTSLIDIIRNDLSSFVDIGKDLLVDDSGAKWIQNKKEMVIRFTRGEYYPNVVFQNKQYTYKDFFASEYMADLFSLSESMLIYLPNEEKTFIKSQSKIKDRDEIPQTDIINMINNIIASDLPFNKTKLLFIRGEAGLGKTSSLRYLTRQSARDYRSGKNRKLFFYIDAQSKSLSRLDDVVAAIILDLQAKFHYRSLATLTRLGLLIPIIDGFDELIGLGGYGEAFDSLTRFISRLDADGTVIASARSTFYEYSGIRDKVIRYENIGNIDYELDEIELLKWDDKSILEYIIQKLDIEEKEASQYYQQLLKNVIESEKELMKIPFFISTILDIATSEKLINKDERLILQIIDHFIDREAKKLINRNGQMLLPKEAHYAFLTQIAEEMWWLESTEIDLDTIKLAAEIFADAYIPEKEEKNTFIEKSPTYAFWKTSSEDSRKYVFSHEYYYSFFTSRFIYQHISSGNDTIQIFNRGTIAPTIATEFGYTVAKENKEKEILSLISNRRIPYIASEGNQENAGIIISAIIHGKSLCKSYEISNAVLNKVTLSNKLFESCKFNNVKFNYCNLANTKFINTSIDDCIFYRPSVVIGKTDFGGIKLKIENQVIGLCVTSESGTIDVYNPVDIRRIGAEINISLENTTDDSIQEPSNKKKYEMALKFLKISNRCYYISDDDLIKSGIKINNEWKEIEDVFINTNIMQFKHIDRKGHKSIVRKLIYNPDEIMKAENNLNGKKEIKDFWKQLYCLK